MIIRANFEEEGPHQWVYNYEVGELGSNDYKGYRFSVRNIDGHLEVAIKAKITKDPSLEDWTSALKVFNSFIQKEIIAKEKE